MILINNFEIFDNGQKLKINVETNVGSMITDIILWKNSEYRDPLKGISLAEYLINEDNVEEFTVISQNIGISTFDGIYVIEVFSNYESDDECEDNCSVGVGVTYDISKHFACLINYIIDSGVMSDCKDCPSTKNEDLTMTLILLFNSISYLLENCMYSEAEEMYEKIKKICSLKTCLNCDEQPIVCKSCKNFKQL